MDRDELESQVTDALDDERYGDAATLALDEQDGYGAEWYGYLIGTLEDEVEAEEVYAEFCLNFFEGLSSFQGKSTIRTWGYSVLRNTRNEYSRAKGRRIQRAVPVDIQNKLRQLVDRTTKLVDDERTPTPRIKRTSFKEQVRELRRELPEEDRDILVLRVDRDLAWKEVARIMLDEDDPGDEAIRKESNRVRKRFQRIKTKLAELGRERGLLND